MNRTPSSICGNSNWRGWPEKKASGSDCSAETTEPLYAQPMDLSIIIVNWNSLGYLRKCIRSVYKHVHGISIEIVVVDNASPELGVETVNEEFPAVNILKSTVNLGFAGANNLGFRQSSGDFVLFLNPDTELVDDAFATVLRTAKSLADAGIIGCKLLNSDLTIQTSCIQTFPTIPNQLLDYEFLRLRWPNSSFWNIGPLFSDSDAAASVEVISGACMLMKRETFERAGFFTEDYFMYAEDLDLCYKVKALGLRNYYVGKAQVIHHGGQSSNRMNVSNWATIMKFKAVHKFCVRWHGSLYGWVFRAAMGSAAILRLGLLMLMKPWPANESRKRMIEHATSKWLAVLKWSYGVDGTVLKAAVQR
jgi:N-acetylglucosaminyl-diphospho-decaprenol L-rhamnosyltransferase